MSEWFPIDSAPKDGTRVWIFCPNFPAPANRMWVGSYYGYEGDLAWYAEHYGKLDDYYLPTHWMPLPQPPAGQ